MQVLVILFCWIMQGAHFMSNATYSARDAFNATNGGGGRYDGRPNFPHEPRCELWPSCTNAIYSTVEGNLLQYIYFNCMHVAEEYLLAWCELLQFRLMTTTTLTIIWVTLEGILILPWLLIVCLFLHQCLPCLYHLLSTIPW